VLVPLVAWVLLHLVAWVLLTLVVKQYRIGQSEYC